MGFEYIDPMVFDGPVSGKRFLYWGSGFQPIKVQQLAEDHKSFAPASEAVDIIWPNPVKGAFPRLVEAAWVIHHDEFYYIFYSGDNCCGPDAEYGVMVARSRDPTGPFETFEEARGVPHSLMLFKSERWLAPGHNSIVTDKAGDVWIVYHAIDVNRPRQRQDDEINSRRILLIDQIQWKDGWPYVGTPSDGLQTAPVVVISGLFRSRLTLGPILHRHRISLSGAEAPQRAAHRRDASRRNRPVRTGRPRQCRLLSQPGRP